MRRGNGEGSIFKLSGKRRRPYAVRVTVGYTQEGKQIYKYIGYYTTKTEAKAALREYLVNPYNLLQKDVRLIDVYEKWEKSTDLALPTLNGYKSAFNQSYGLHRMKMRDIKVPHLKETMLTLKPSMQAIFRNVMSQLYAFAIEEDIVDKDLSSFLAPKKSEAKERKPFTIEEINKIKKFNHKYTNIVIILLYTGMRINELLELKKENVNLEQRYFYGGKKSINGKTRYTPIHDEIYDLVKQYYDSSKVYLIEYDRKPVIYNTFLRTYWKRLKNYLGTDHTPHSTRHTFVTFADRCDIKRSALKKMVGHSMGDVTDNYTYKDIKELLEEINKLKYE